MSQAFWRSWLDALRPSPLQPDWRERARAGIGACVGLLFMAMLAKAIDAYLPGSPWMLAPMGASAVLVFAVPSGPLAQPWSVVVGNTVSAVVGTAFALSGLEPVVAGPAAVGLAIALMLTTRSLHPPGGAVALTAVFAHATDWTFPVFPVLISSVLLVFAGIAYNSLTGRPYPHKQAPTPSPGKDGERAPSPLAEVLQRYNQMLDISVDDLEGLLHQAELSAYRRRLDDLRCDRIMTRNPITVEFGTTLQEAWDLLLAHRIKALPVVDRYKHLVGIVTLRDFIHHAGPGTHVTLGRRLRQLLRPSRRLHGNKPEVVGQIMSRQVRVASAERPIMDLLPIFTDGGHRHIPIVTSHRKLVGIITQSDFLRAWSRAVHND